DGEGCGFAASPHLLQQAGLLDLQRVMPAARLDRPADHLQCRGRIAAGEEAFPGEHQNMGAARPGLEQLPSERNRFRSPSLADQRISLLQLPGEAGGRVCVGSVWSGWGHDADATVCNVEFILSASMPPCRVWLPGPMSAARRGSTA